MVTVLPAIVSVPLRDDVVVLAATEKFTGPFPEPLPPLVTEIQDALLVAVQAQPLVVVTVEESVAAAPEIECVIGATVKTQAPACVTVSVRPAIVSVPVRGVVNVFVAAE